MLLTVPRRYFHHEDMLFFSMTHILLSRLLIAHVLLKYQIKVCKSLQTKILIYSLTVAFIRCSCSYLESCKAMIFYTTKINLGHNKIGQFVRLPVCPLVCPSVRIFLKGMPFELYIYLGAFVTYCDPILIFYKFRSLPSYHAVCRSAYRNRTKIFLTVFRPTKSSVLRAIRPRPLRKDTPTLEFSKNYEKQYFQN